MGIEKDLPAHVGRLLDGATEDFVFLAQAINDPVVLSLIEIAVALGQEERDQLLFFAESLQAEAFRMKTGVR